ncbi:hypothetical protein FGSG_02141 [Fusarium graminearum PH-1]|uniref:Chromosome 1, complete genome n=1 Tax=Gibberella zeae (strain ATCC MYA-4620 / CBS 123657 / FGSC 9075 / NRRL 31084 / PH-1) TaxID=229533 RepID=I1REP7_GIBZE|nr:hypothetical protein FGSG_02141 [Fusarium graminearum PH-1]ESU07536.1 hypothetical protein FGSG_02141 [Fusarium graminearum PH-1]EYB26000.1 hypothetical protein FG05_02141 [Fusarium graminearum]KAI6771133.1 hypothetical protein HG531_009988 [Fusarium graminearum]CEF74384.1 unnamed protein product [Fusarium graminearum]|eukprot:XP_011318021.1 hypothetical protein FGSG_02141 [Fusarium graminearum PH-1]
MSQQATSSTPVDADTIAPPSYTAQPPGEAPTDEKIAIEQPHINDDNLPEVVTEPTHQQPPAQTSPQTSPPPPVSTVSPVPTSIMNWDGTQSPPILQHPAVAQQQQQQQQQYQYAGQENMSIPMQPQPPMQRSGPTVTPLHLLADQADSVDCPFCQHQTETKVKKSPSGMTHVYAAALFFGTFFGVMCPYICHCASNVSHYCKNCGRKVAMREYRGEMTALGTPDHLREASKYPAAPPPAPQK